MRRSKCEFLIRGKEVGERGEWWLTWEQHAEHELALVPGVCELGVEEEWGEVLAGETGGGYQASGDVLSRGWVVE
jgi:hypothetical protein